MRQSALVTVAMLMAASPAAAQESVPTADGEPRDAAAPRTHLVARLFTTIGRDIWQLPKENGSVLSTGAMLAIGMYPMDAIATEGASSSKILKVTFGSVGKTIGREWVQGGGALAAYVAGQLWDNARLVEASGDLIEAQLVSVTLTQAAKFAVSRTRPDGEARSFPSGHASAAFATATVLERHYGAKIAIPAYAIAVYTSLSRLQANSHYASDVIAGATLGIAVGRTATMRVGQHRLQVAPAPVDGGFAVMAVLRD
jgi:hypothetical protein